MSTVQPLGCLPFKDSTACRCLRAALGAAHDFRLFCLDAADRMEAAALHVVAHAFHFTAAQQQEHTAILAGLLACHGVPAEQPDCHNITLPSDPIDLLEAARHSFQPCEADIAAIQVEGHPRIARTLQRIAETDRQQQERFARYLTALREGTLFHALKRTSWFCLGCGQIHAGPDAPPACSACGRNQGHFIRSTFFPFSREG